MRYVIKCVCIYIAETLLETATNSESPCFAGTGTLVGGLAPYLYPLIIEFSVVVVSMWISVWENCGVGVTYSHPTNDKNHGASRGTLHRGISQATEVVPLEKMSGYKNQNIGFLLGWVILLGTVSLTLVFIFMLLDPTSYLYEGNPRVVYSYSCVLSILLLIAMPVTGYRLSALPSKENKKHKDEELGNKVRNHLSHVVDRRLLFITAMSMVIYKLLCLICGAATGQYVLLVDAVFSILAGMVGTVFIYIAFEKYSFTHFHRKTKPGRQGLEFMRFTNLSLWIVNTFLLKSPVAREDLYELYGPVGGASLSNVFQPLTILFYFHSMICIAEVIVDVYSDKHVYTMETHEDHLPGIQLESSHPVEDVPFDYVPKQPENNGWL